jgi:LmbE family N-acetylglucosaminyl deacetylase
MISLSKLDRLLVVAPHPDDESLGTGGLLQRAFANGAEVRVLFATNGDNNPWAQRYWEQRWAINVNDRERWGARRKEEALAAISCLGGSSQCARFLDLPDQGLTKMLLDGGVEIVDRLIQELQEYQPTVLAIPTRLDAHPDHSALAVLLAFAIKGISVPPKRILEYLIHRPRMRIRREQLALRLTREEVERKYEAILRHETQVALSRARFTAYARSEEAYYPFVGATSDVLPLVDVSYRSSALTLRLVARKRERIGSSLLLISGVEDHHPRHCWRIPLPVRSDSSSVVDCSSGSIVSGATVRWSGRQVSVVVPLFDMPPLQTLFVKLAGWAVFFDRSGWCQATPLSNAALKEHREVFATAS